MYFKKSLPFILATMLLAVGCGLNSRTDAGNSIASAVKIDNSLGVSTATTQFTIAVSPGSVTIAPGKSGSAKITTTVVSGFNHALQLSASGVPSGVTVKLNPTQIPAPGSGSSAVSISVGSTVAAGTYSIGLKAADGTLSATATLTLKVSSSSDPGATFQGCMYTTGGHSYQAVKISVKNPGKYPFYANLYYGSTCSQWADDFGNGQLINFGGFDYTFWFDHFPDQKNMSAIWQVGPDTSKCIAYATAPSC